MSRCEAVRSRARIRWKKGEWLNGRVSRRKGQRRKRKKGRQDERKKGRKKGQGFEHKEMKRRAKEGLLIMQTCSPNPPERMATTHANVDAATYCMAVCFIMLCDRVVGLDLRQRVWVACTLSPSRVPEIPTEVAAAMWGGGSDMALETVARFPGNLSQKVWGWQATFRIEKRGRKAATRCQARVRSPDIGTYARGTAKNSDDALPPSP